MGKLGLLKKACIIVSVLAVMAITAHAQTFTTLFNFDQTDGTEPGALIQATDGNFYGTSVLGGTSPNCVGGCGSFFQMTPEGVLTTLHDFESTDGAQPNTLIQATDGNFYGTTSQGGVYGCGTVFKITSAGTLTTLYSFSSQTNCPNSQTGNASLIQATDGNFYGTTGAYGANGLGSVFAMTPSGILTTLHSFSGGDGAGPSGLTQATDGKFYGTTGGGGAYGFGTVFQITSAGEFSSLHSFCASGGTGCPDGWAPQTGVIQGTDGNFYGTTHYGGTHQHGTVFEITNTGTLYTVYPFCFQTGCRDGSYPESLIQAADGNFYGTTYSGGAHQYGTVFDLSAGTHYLVTQHSFDLTDGAHPILAVQATDGSFYGTTFADVANQLGTVFRMVMAPAAKISTLSLSFGNLALGEISAAKTVWLTNTGTALMNVNGVALSDSDNFAMSDDCPPVLAKGQRCSAEVTFTPKALGKITGSLTFTDNASTSPQTVTLVGTAVVPASLTPTTAAYAARVLGTTCPARTFTLTNNQTVALNSIAISTSGDFAVSATTCTTNLAAKGKCTISVTFTPTKTGTRTGSLSVSDSANNSPQAASLTGTGK